MKKMFKISSFLLSLVLLLSSFSVIAFAEDEGNDATEEPAILLGDIDLNGKLETTDARFILRLSAGMEAVTEDVLVMADMNSDGIISVEDAVLALRAVAKVEVGGVVIPDKNGDNYLTDDSNNEFIKLIASTYNLDPASLVAIYSVPDSGTNYVLEFKGSGILGNKPPYEKSVDNLKTVYQIGKAPEREIAYTDGKLKHHNCSSGEGILVFNIIQTMVMEQYPDYFEGVEKTE